MVSAVLIQSVKYQYVLPYVETKRNMEHNNVIMAKMLVVRHVWQKEDSVVLAKQAKSLYVQPFVETATRQVLRNATIEIKQDALVARQIQIIHANNLELYLFVHANDLKIKFILINHKYIKEILQFYRIFNILYHQKHHYLLVVNICISGYK